MIKSNDKDDNFDDLDLIDDIEDTWDDIDEETDDPDDGVYDVDSNINAKTPKKKNIVKPLIILTLIGGGSLYAYLSFIKSSEPPNQVPIIKLGESPISDVNKPSEVSTEIGTTTNNKITPPLEQNANIPEVTTNNIPEGVLTPMPENIGNSDITLPNLDLGETLTTNSLSQSEHAELPKEEILDVEETLEVKEIMELKAAPIVIEELEDITAQPTFSEDDLLSQTEITFEDEKVEEDTNIADQEIKQQELPVSPVTNNEVLEHAELPKEEILEVKEIPEVKEIVEAKETLEVKEIMEPIATPVVIEEPLKIEETAAIDEVEEAPIDEVKSDTSETIPTPKVKNIKKTTTTPTKNNTPIWVIRAAQSGSAVIYNKTTGEMLSIEINDKVAGIGRVKSIKSVNGQWIITGTSGKIKQ